MMLIVDGHQDLAWNIATFGRDYTLSADEIRRLERGTEIPSVNGDTLLGWQEYQSGQVAIVFATLFAAPMRHKLGKWDTQCYRDPKEANALYRSQVDIYYRLVDDNPEKFRFIFSKLDLQAVLSAWAEQEVEDGYPVGLVLLMENAEGVLAPSELEAWWELGVRLIGPAWAGTRFCGGTKEPGPLTKEGFALLEVMGDLGFALDLSHMDEIAALQALDHYPGTIVATHANAARLLGNPSNRFLSDRLISGILERDGVIGVVPANNFLRRDWKLLGGRQVVTLDYLIAQIDTICQMAGDAQHVALGSDFDGGFGVQSVPAEIDTIADLWKMVPLLQEKGYSEVDITAILGGNWLAKLELFLPEEL
jgi:membrane dipeptidase